MNIKLLTLSIFTTTIITGCVTFNTSPQEPWDKKKENKDLLIFVEKDHITEYLELKDDTQKQPYLIKLATAKIYLIDNAYINYKNKLKKHKGLTFGTAATSQMFSTAATLFTPNSTKTLLSAGATSVTGLQGSYDKHLLAEKSIEAILNQMDAQRAIVYKSIRERLGDPNYTIIDLNRHLELYADAGTIEAAMREITNTTASNNVSAQAELTYTSKFGATDNSSTIDLWLKDNNSVGVRNSEKAKILTQWLKNTDALKKPNLADQGHITQFIKGDYHDLRNRFITEVINNK